MQWVPDRTGRFRRRPHYEPAELDRELGALVVDFLRERHGTVQFPISTDDLTILVERHAVLDPYADLSDEGPDVEGVTYFRANRPLVRVSTHLSTNPRMHNRYRTTLTHELSHVRLHAFLWTFEAPSQVLLPDAYASCDGPRCKRESIINPASRDWMEWQAAHGCGALLMPAAEVRELLGALRLGASPLPAVGVAADRALHALMEQFEVSEDAARVRLFKLGEFRAVQAQPLSL